jgi:hypothetical protein
MNAAGKVVIQPVFDDARPFSEGLASVQLNQRWGAIDLTGRLVIPCTHTIGLDFSEEVAQFEDGSRRGLLARDGTVILGQGTGRFPTSERVWPMCGMESNMASSI